MARPAFGPIRCNFAPWLKQDVTPIIQFKNVTKKFGDFVAVENLNLNIYEREFFALLGPSGCGKTTLLRMLAGFETPTSGEILLDGKPMDNFPIYKRPMNMMFQSYALFPHMSVEKNIAFGLVQERMPKPDIEARVNEVMELVQLTKFAKRKPHQLSGGQQQRVALARAVAKRPKVLLLDEPLGALDKKLRENTQFELMDLQERLGMTFVIVTHDQEEAMTVASRIAVMNNGIIAQVDTPSNMYEEPSSRYVADFIGDINVLPVKEVERSNGMVNLKSETENVDLKTTEGMTSQTVNPCWLAVRPEKITTSLDAPPSDKHDNCVKGKVVDIGYLGNISVFNVKLPSGQVVKSKLVNAKRTYERPITWEDEVYLSWSADSCILLQA